MLKIYFGTLPGEIYNTEVYYENQYKKDWVLDNFARKVIRDIDASEVIAPDLIENDIFGSFSSTELSAGVKTLLLIRNVKNKIFNISNCGDNCVPYLLELAQDRDIKVTLHHAMNLGNDFAVKVKSGNRWKIITDPTEFLMYAHRCLRGDEYEG